LQDGLPYDLGRIDLGNGTAVRMVVTPVSRASAAMVSIENWRAYPFNFDGMVLHYTYVGEKLMRRWNACDAVALTLILGVILGRKVGVRGGCDCPVHREKED
jgi:hypothetical protein